MRVRTRARIAAAASAVVALVVALAACSVSPQTEVTLPPQVDRAFPDDVTAQFDDAVANAMAATGASGAIVGVWAPWSGAWTAGVGTQYPGSSDAVTTDMSFRVGQLTRPMTCDVLYAVAAEGRVNLDDPVPMYVSGVADLTDVTLGDLCDGTSGIGSYSGQLRPLWIANPSRVWNPRELASFGLGADRTTEPGEGFRDSDAGYVLLGLALERATGKTASALIQQYVAAPLGLTGTQLPSVKPAAPSGDPLTGLVSLPIEGGVNCVEPLDITEVSSSIGYTDSGVVSTLDDMRHYVQALATGASAPSEAAADRFEGGKPTYAKAPSWLTTAGGAVLSGSLVGQSGWVPGYSTAAYSDPSTGLTVVVVLNNSATNQAGALAWELASLASKAPAAEGQTAPEAGLPWTAEQYHQAIAARPVCAPPAAG
ncbi:serine hydrolase domain-containing protein [Microbacterium aoyamense]|uniref:Serine hydrolase domain-containing protein n=1 Tax=Microbacterium aoyamense TaxID=344166 RepID=A0ABN2PIV2_9MICO|nr:serine hydrolase domain-containing protein [Microbacterium aoyamense]